MNIIPYFSGLFDSLSDFILYDSLDTIEYVASTIILSVLAAFIYDLIRKRDTRAAEDFVCNSLCEFVKSGKIPNGNLIETLINEAAKKYNLEVYDLPAPDVFVDHVHVNLLNDSLYEEREKNEVRSLLEYIKNRCKRSCKYSLWLIIKKGIDFFVFTTLVIVLVFVLFIVFGFIRFYDIDYCHILLLLTLIGFLLYFCISCYFSNPRKKKLCLDEIESSWNKFKRNRSPWKYVPVIGMLIMLVIFIVLSYFCFHNFGNNFHLLLLLTLIGFIVLFCYTCCFSNPIEEELRHDEIVNAWKRYLKEGNEEAGYEHWQLASICYYKALETYPASEIKEYEYRKLHILLGKTLKNLDKERFHEALDLLKEGLKQVHERKECQEITCEELLREIQLEGEVYCYMACIFAKSESKNEFKEVLSKIKKLDQSIVESVFNELESWLKKNIKNPEDYIELVKQSKTQK